MEIVPKRGLKGLVQNWQSDSLAAISVALVAIPLCVGIAVASNMPPMSGILAAIIGGVVTTFFRGSFVGINGPSKGLIAVILGSIAVLDDGTGQALNYVLAAIVLAGFLQFLLGLFKLGRYADVFHSSVIKGILGAIGIIIIANQIHVTMGTTSKETETLEILLDALRQIGNINPFVAVVSVMGLILLIFDSRISYKLFRFLPAPLWILILSIPFAFMFNYFEANERILFGRSYSLGPELLLNLPDNLMDSIMHPNFGKIDTLPFWVSVFSITIIATIESLASSKAVDKLDPYKRKTDLNKDMIGVGLGTMVSGLIGGLPVITVILRSTVNVHNNAKTRWSNLYHGLFLLVFIILLAPFMKMVPLAALAIILVFTGFKLASPKIFAQTYDQGIEQPIFFVGTLIITLFTNMLVGIFCGLFLAMGTHILLARVPPITFFKLIFQSGSTVQPRKDGSYLLKVLGISNFLGAVKLDDLIDQIPEGKNVTIDLAEAKLVDFSILERLYDYQRSYSYSGGEVEIIGLDKHMSSSNHKLALKILIGTEHEMSPREVSLNEMAREYGWDFNNENTTELSYLETFYFFKSRPIEEKINCLSGHDQSMYWEFADVIFEEGALEAYHEYRTTIGLIKCPYPIPKFTIEQKGLLKKLIDLPGHKDIDYTIYHDFDGGFEVKVEDTDEMEKFLTPGIKTLIESSDIHHLESNGEAILIFNDSLRLAKILEYSKIIQFSEDLRKEINLGKVGDGIVNS